jgi:hypothetical protein
MRTKLFLWAVLFLAVLPIVFSFNCDFVSDKDYCEEIQESTLKDKEEIYSFLLYEENSIPNFEIIEDYNEELEMTSPPFGAIVKNSKYIKNAWLSFSALSPAVYEDDILYVPPITQALSHYNYNVQLPSNYYASEYPQESYGDCKRTYHLTSNTAVVNYYFNGINKGIGTLIDIASSGTILAKLTISVGVNIRHYHWQKYWSWWHYDYIYKCEYSHSNHESNHIIITEDKEVSLYVEQPLVNVEIINTYSDTVTGEFSAEDYSLLQINFPESSITKKQKTYNAVFEKQPHHIAYLEASDVDVTAIENIYLDQETFWLKNADECSILASNHFYSLEKDCELEEKSLEVKPLEIEKKKLDLSVLYYILLFLGVIYLIYKIFKSQCKKIFVITLLLVLLIPFVSADSGDEEECGITNLASCLPTAFYNFILAVINAPLAPLLVSVEKLLTTEVTISLFYHIWSIIRYMISFFYIFLILYAGYVFLTASADPIRRAHAKELLKNLIIIIVLIQGSYYIYDLLINLSSNMSASIISFVDPHFFLLTADNLANIGLEMIFAFTYMLTLFATVLLLVFRYIMVAVGVIFFPIGIFCYFIPPLKGYGKFIINLFGVMIFITFFDLLIILVCSEIVNIALFANMKILVMITCFGIVNYTLWLATKFAIKRSTSGSLKDDLNQAVKYIALLA